MGIDGSLNPNPELAREVQPTSTHRTRGIPTRNGTATTRQFLSGSGSERTDSPRVDGVASQRALVGDSLNDEQWSDDLSDPPSY